MSYLSSSIENSMFLPHIDENEISTIIKSIRNGNSGWDNLPLILFKSCISSFIKPLTYIVNKSFKSGIFSDPLKLAKIVPIFKSGDKKIISNYRPISVLTFFSKIFEKAISKYLLAFLDSNNTLYKFQFGFRKKYSASHAIISIVERINTALNAGKHVAGVFLGFRKAYDTVNHSILLKKYHRHRTGTVTAPSPHRHRPVTAPLPHRHRTVTSRHRTVTTHRHHTVTAPSPHRHRTVTAPSPHRHRTVTTPSPHRHHTVTAPSPHCRHAVTVMLRIPFRVQKYNVPQCLLLFYNILQHPTVSHNVP